MTLQCLDKVIDGRVHTRPGVWCEACNTEIEYVSHGLVFWTPYARTQVAYSHKWCSFAFADNLHRQELKVFLAQLVRVLRPEKGWNDSA